MNEFSHIDYLLSALRIAVIIPGAFMVLRPTKKWLALPYKKLAVILTLVLIGTCILCTFLGCGTTLNPYVFLIPITCVGFVIALLCIQLPKTKILYLYLCMLAALSFGGLANQMMETFLDPDITYVYVAKVGLLVQWCFSGLALMLFCLIEKKLSWILENFHNTATWYFVWTIPSTILICNIFMFPGTPSIMLKYKLFRVYLVITGTLLFLFIAYQLFFYQIARASAEKYEKEKLTQLFEVQNHQYGALKNYIEKTHRMQHDLKHILRTMQTLSDLSQYEELRRFISEYEQNSRHIFSSPPCFCEHATLNALLGYYEQMAKENNIITNWKIDIPLDYPISDVDINMIFGNLLDNAIKACAFLPAQERYIHLTADRNTQDSLYIVMVNGMDTPKHSFAKGIGLTSITAIAKKYDGVAQFFTQDNTFHSNVMLQITHTT